MRLHRVAADIVVARLGYFGRGCCFCVPPTRRGPCCSLRACRHISCSSMADKVELFDSSPPVHPAQLHKAARSWPWRSSSRRAPIPARHRMPDGVAALIAIVGFRVVRWRIGSAYIPPRLRRRRWALPRPIYVAVLLVCAAALMQRFDARRNRPSAPSPGRRDRRLGSKTEGVSLSCPRDVGRGNPGGRSLATMARKSIPTSCPGSPSIVSGRGDGADGAIKWKRDSTRRSQKVKPSSAYDLEILLGSCIRIGRRCPILNPVFSAGIQLPRALGVLPA